MLALLSSGSSAAVCYMSSEASSSTASLMYSVRANLSQSLPSSSRSCREWLNFISL